jgi:sirohydrochlorin cobaltochelatase
LVLIGHGSHLNPDSAAAVYRYAELLRRHGGFAEVIEAYWKEEPSLRQVLAMTRCLDVVAIPLFISEGYFTEQVIPRELGLRHQGPVPPGGIRESVQGRTVHYTQPFGVHPGMADLVLARAEEVAPGVGGEGVALVVIGHGTGRNSRSAQVVSDSAARLAARGQFGEVLPLFLDQEPRVTRWPELVRSSQVILVPFFTAEGWHTQETIPADLGLEGEVSQLGGRTVYYAKPVGTHPGVEAVLLQLARESSQSSGAGEADPAVEALWRKVTSLAQSGLQLGELMVWERSGLFELYHWLDQNRSDLDALVTLEGLRDRIRRDDAGNYRPVRGQRNLPRGWKSVLPASDLRRALQYVYPAALEESQRHRDRQLLPVPWANTARRQTGIYQAVQRASQREVEALRLQLCGSCLKTPLWAGQTLAKTVLDGVPGGIPCAEACSYFISQLRETLPEPAPS